MEELRKKQQFARDFFFHFRLCERGEEFLESRDAERRLYPSLLFPTESNRRPPYNDLVFVHSEEESENFPNNVLVAWPSEAIAQRRLRGLNHLISNEKIPNWEAYGFSYPITIRNLVDEGDKLAAFWNDEIYARLWTIRTTLFEDEEFFLIAEFFPNPEHEGWIIDFRRGVERANISTMKGFELLRASGSREDDITAFWEITSRMHNEGISFEEAMMVLESGNE